MGNLLLVEILATATIIAVSEIADGHAPQPRAFIAAYVVYLMLAILSKFGPRAERLATAFGGLVLLGVAMKHAGGFVALTSYLTGKGEAA